MKPLTPNVNSVARVLEINEKIEALQAEIKALESEKREIVQADYKAAQDKQQAAARKYSAPKARVLQFLVDHNAYINLGRGDWIGFRLPDHSVMFGEGWLRKSTFDCLCLAGFIKKTPHVASGYGVPSRYDITETGRQALAAWNAGDRK